MLIKYRNLARNTASILWFNTIPAVALFAGFSIAGGASLLAWGGVLLTTLPMLVWVGYVMATQGVARTSERLPLINVQGALGVGLAAYAMKLGLAGGRRRDVRLAAVALGLGGLGVRGALRPAARRPASGEPRRKRGHEGHPERDQRYDDGGLGGEHRCCDFLRANRA